jgi:hypothetical protein
LDNTKNKRETSVVVGEKIGSWFSYFKLDSVEHVLR